MYLMDDECDFEEIYLDEVTIHDCEEAYFMKEKAVVLNDGKVIGFVFED